ncbi:MAG TPA: hypothetical protein PLS01_07090 [Clostridia bacterium]|nr:hypothetical protein [Clostridia bacterium]
MPRITYKSQFGDYGINQERENLNEFELIHLLANRLGQYEDIGTVEELRALMAGKEVADGICDIE